jgi:hypothetical protein
MTGQILDVANYFGADPKAVTPFGKIASIAQLRNFGVSGPAGTASYTPEGLTSTGPGGEAYADLLGLSKSATASAGNIDQHTGDINSLIAQLFQTNGQSPQAQQANDLYGQFGAQLRSFDVNNQAGTFTDILNRMALPDEQRAASALGNRLFASGRVGSQDTTGGRAMGELATQQSIAQDSRTLSAYQLANQQFNTLANATNTFGNLGSTLTSSNIANFGRISAAPGALQSGYISNANSSIQGANSALGPMDAQLQRLFQGAQMSGAQKEQLASALSQKYATNKANGENAGWSGALSGGISGAMAGFQAGGPWGALAGGIAGGASGYYSSPAPASDGGGGSDQSAMGGGMGNIFSMFGQPSGGGATDTWTQQAAAAGVS